MAWATLTQDIVANNDDDENEVISEGTYVEIEDHGETWFNFYHTPNDDDRDEWYYTCKEKPSEVLQFDSDKDAMPVAVAEQYKPVPNMTPLSRKFLLL